MKKYTNPMIDILAFDVSDETNTQNESITDGTGKHNGFMFVTPPPAGGGDSIGYNNEGF